jgi:peptidoglycan/LPS O-acetylase OafA/YrhL
MKDEGSIHLKGLNGIRAIAALAVVYQHIMQNSWEVGSNRLKSTDLAMYGVTIFFSLSGFLITYLLLLEKQKSGTISVLSFYKRRILRIWPLYYLYLFVACLVMWLCHTKPLDFNLLYYVFLAANIPFFLVRPFHSSAIIGLLVWKNNSIFSGHGLLNARKNWSIHY